MIFAISSKTSGTSIAGTAILALLISVMMTTDLLKPLAYINPAECVGNGEAYYDAFPKYNNNLLSFVTHTYSDMFEISEYKVKEII